MLPFPFLPQQKFPDLLLNDALLLRKFHFQLFRLRIGYSKPAVQEISKAAAVIDIQ